MNLTRFFLIPEFAAKVKPLRPKISRKINAQLKAAPRSNRFAMVGTAFDYLLRFELQRRAPHARSERLIAESASDLIWQPGIFSYPSSIDAAQVSPEEAEEAAKKEAKRLSNVVEKAKASVAAYVKMNEPDHSAQTDLAAHAIRLAKVDEMCRVGELNPSLDEADPEDVEDLVALLAIVPFDALIHPQIMLLNPTFEGADTDLITGDMLVDFKTTKSGAMQVVNLDQLLGYYLFAGRRRRVDPAFPAINRLALYFCRHGFLWMLDVTAWTNQPSFHEVEEWFSEWVERSTSPAAALGKRKEGSHLVE